MQLGKLEFVAVSHRCWDVPASFDDGTWVQHSLMEQETASPSTLKPVIVTFLSGVAVGAALYSLYHLYQSAISSSSAPATPEPMDVQDDHTALPQTSDENQIAEDVDSGSLDSPMPGRGTEADDEEWEDMDEVSSWNHAAVLVY